LRNLFVLFLILLTGVSYGADFAVEYPTGVALEVVTPTSGASTYLKLDGSNSPMTGDFDSVPDTDGTFTLGRLKFGYMDPLWADVGVIAHYDRFNTTDFALAQDATGNTYLNSANFLYFIAEGANYFGRMYMAGGTVKTFHLNSDTVFALGGAFGSERVEITQSGTDPTILDIDTDYSNLLLNVNGDITATDDISADTLTETGTPLLLHLAAPNQTVTQTPNFSGGVNIGGAAGVGAMATNGLLTFTGLGDGTDEAWTVNLNSTNLITHSSTTGAIPEFLFSDTEAITVSEIFRLTHYTSAYTGAGFGSAVDFYLPDSIGNPPEQALRLTSLWTNAVSGSESSAFTISGKTSGGALTEWMRVTAATTTLSNGNILQVNSAGDDKNIQIYHNDADGQIYVGTGSLEFGTVNGRFGFKYGTTDMAAFYTDTNKDQNLFAVDDDGGNQLVIGNFGWRTRDFDHNSTTDPTLFIHSDIDPDVSNNQWGSFAHDQENFVITTGANVGTGTGATTDDNGIVFAPRGTTSVTFNGTGNIDAIGKITTYNNVATEGYGVPAIVDHVALTGQSASIGTTNFTNAGTAGLYRVNYYLEATTLNAGATSVLATFGWTDDAGATTTVSATLVLTALGRTSGIFYVQLASGNLTYATTLVDVSGLARYALYMTCERVN